MTPDPIEAVARAISEAGGAVSWDHALRCARAAIAAMPKVEALAADNARMREVVDCIRQADGDDAALLVDLNLVPQGGLQCSKQ